MRILQVIESSSGGSGRHTIDLSLGLWKLGHHVDLIYAKARIDDRFARGVAQLNELGATTTCIDIPLKIGLGDFAAARKIRSILKSGDGYDVIHLQSSKAGASGRLARIGMNQATVYTPHLLRTASPGLSKGAELIYKRIELFLAKWTDRLIMVSPFEYDHAVSIGLPKEKLVMIENCGAPEPMGDRKILREQLGLREDDFVLGFVGRLAPQKDPLCLLEAMVQLKDLPNVKLVMIGHGELDEACRSYCNENGLKDRVKFLGQAEGAYWMPAFDVFALPSASESWPYVILEAAQAGLPIIGTRVGSVPEFVLDGQSGLLVDPGRPTQFAAAIRRLAGDPAELLAMGKNSLARSQDYSLEKMVNKTIQVYQEAMKLHGRNPESSSGIQNQ